MASLKLQRYRLKPDMLEAVYRVSTHVGLTEPGFINVVPIEPL